MVAKEIWERALGGLQIQVSKSNYNTWLSKSRGISYQDDVFVVGVPNSFVAEWLSQRLYSLVRKTLTNIVNREIDVQFVVSNSSQVGASHLIRTCPADGGTSSKVKASKLNPRYTFDNFVVGDCNRLAYAAAMEVAESPGHAWNPLFIRSDTGQGKTHLLHAIGRVVASKGLQVVYTSAEQFTNDFVLAVKQKQVEDFRSKFKSIQALLLDDIQFINNKKQTQQCFFHIFNDLYNNSCQIVITSDRSPKSLILFSNKLRSRLECGLFSTIRPPDFETRLSILNAKAKQMRVSISEEVLRLLAARIQGNVRQLEGVLAYIAAQAKLTGADLTPQSINKLLTSIAYKGDRMAIARVVANYFDLPIEELVGKRRDKRIALARQITMYLMREESGYSLAEIGKELGNRNHATVLHGCEKIASEMSVNSKLCKQIVEIRNKINADKPPVEEY